MIKDLKFSTKLGLLVGLGLLGLAVTSIAAFRVETKAEAAVVRMSGTELKLVIGLNDLYALGLQTEQATRNVLLNPRDGKAKDNYRAAHEEFLKTLAAVLPIALPAMRDRLDLVGAKWAKDHALKMEIQQLAEEGKVDQAVSLLVSKETPLWREVKATLLELQKEQERTFDVNREALVRDLRRQRWVIIVTAVLVAVGFLVFSVPTARSTSRRLEALTQFALRIAGGDL